MLQALASGLLVGALVSGAGGLVGTLLAAAFWAWATWRRGAGDSSVSPHHENRRQVVVVALLTLVAIVVRWPIASHDVEHYAGPDEGEVVENVLEMIRMGDFDHRHPGYPGLHFYLQRIPAELHLVATGRSIPELPRSGFYLGARRLTLLAGVLAGAVVFGVGRRFLSAASAALSASLVLLSPLAFRESAVVNPDLMLMLFVTLSVYASLRLLDRSSWSAYALAGVFVGLATAIKYTGAFTLAPFSVAWLLSESPRRALPKWMAGAALSGLVFAAVSPYTLLNLWETLRGLAMHVGYYQAARMNAPLALTHQVAVRGVGIVAALAALAAAVRALAILDRSRLVLLSYPFGYWFVFSLFDRAFPRHALVLVPFVALFAGDAFDRIASRAPRWARALSAFALLLGPLLGSIDLWRRAHRPTPADAARSWALAELPAGSRVLQDQHTPRLDPARYRVHRLRVEEKYFVGNYDWVFYSGYPPGLRTRGLREVARFENVDALGDAIIIYAVPDRESLMPVSFARGRARASIGAGQLSHFGEGWYPPRPGAFETSRLSRGRRSELFFRLPPDFSGALEAELIVGAAVGERTLKLQLNEVELTTLSYERTHEAHRMMLPAEALKPGLNRMDLTYDAVTRLDRRHQDTAIRFYRLNLRKK